MQFIYLDCFHNFAKINWTYNDATIFNSFILFPGMNSIKYVQKVKIKSEAKVIYLTEVFNTDKNTKVVLRLSNKKVINWS